jgi:hypothetical protein
MPEKLATGRRGLVETNALRCQWTLGKLALEETVALWRKWTLEETEVLWRKRTLEEVEVLWRKRTLKEAEVLWLRRTLKTANRPRHLWIQRNGSHGYWPSAATGAPIPGRIWPD